MAMVKLSDNFTFYAQTFTPSTGEAVDADEAPGYRVYSLESGTPLLTGSMALLDDAGTVGFYSETIAVTAANGFAAGGCYVVRITGVVGGVTGVALVPFQVQTYDLDDVALPGSAMTLATNAVSAAALATDAVNEIADAVWDEATAGHAGAGTTGKALSDAGAAGDPWVAAIRTLTQPAAQIAAIVAGEALLIKRGDTWVQPLTGLGDISTRTALVFTIKRRYDDADAEALIQITEDGGLVLFEGSDEVTAGDASLTVDNESNGNVTIQIAAAITAALTVQYDLLYDIQMLTETAVLTMTEGTLMVSPDVTRAVE